MIAKLYRCTNCKTVTIDNPNDDCEIIINVMGDNQRCYGDIVEIGRFQLIDEDED